MKKIVTIENLTANLRMPLNSGSPIDQSSKSIFQEYIDRFCIEYFEKMFSIEFMEKLESEEIELDERTFDQISYAATLFVVTNLIRFEYGTYTVDRFVQNYSPNEIPLTPNILYVRLYNEMVKTNKWLKNRIPDQGFYFDKYLLKYTM